MFIEKSVVVNAVYYNNNDDEVFSKLPDLKKESLENIRNGNYIIMNEDKTLTIINPQEFNKKYVEIEQVINNISTSKVENTETKEPITIEKELINIERKRKI